jgi:alpha-galactosidase
MGFEPVGEWPYDPEHPATVYAEGWQTWSPMRLYRLGEESQRPASARDLKVMFRLDKPQPEGVIQAEGVLVVSDSRGARAWFAPDPSREVPTLRVGIHGSRAVVTADGDVESIDATTQAAALDGVGERLRTLAVRKIPPGWCSWSYYFKHVTEADVVENVEAARRLEVPIEVVQIDDGYETAIGDWSEVDRRFGSLRRCADAIRAAGMVAGIWIAPFMVDPRSRLAAQHPDWLLPDVDAGEHWGVTMRILDIANRDAANHLRLVFHTFSGWGYRFFKLDFLYAAAIPGLSAYREGMQLVREAVGEDAVLLIGGAPLLPSIGLCDAMRVGPDVLPETPHPQLDIEPLKQITSLRSWMNGRLWVNDPDHVVARKQLKDRDEWAAYIETYGGVTFSGDRLAALDPHGMELTRRVMARSRSTRV